MSRRTCPLPPSQVVLKKMPCPSTHRSRSRPSRQVHLKPENQHGLRKTYFVYSGFGMHDNGLLSKCSLVFIYFLTGQKTICRNFIHTIVKKTKSRVWLWLFARFSTTSAVGWTLAVVATFFPSVFPWSQEFRKGLPRPPAFSSLGALAWSDSDYSRLCRRCRAGLTRCGSPPPLPQSLVFGFPYRLWTLVFSPLQITFKSYRSFLVTFRGVQRSTFKLGCVPGLCLTQNGHYLLQTPVQSTLLGRDKRGKNIRTPCGENTSFYRPRCKWRHQEKGTRCWKSVWTSQPCQLGELYLVWMTPIGWWEMLLGFQPGWCGSIWK